MLRRLLADRFQLQVEAGSKEQPVWAIVAAAGGPKLRPLPADQPCANSISYQDMIAAGAPPSTMPSAPSTAAASMTWCRPSTAPATARCSAAPVVDPTGIQGHYAMLVWQSYDSVEAEPGGRGRRMVGLETFRQAVEKELGLRLVPATAPLGYLHVVKLSHPTPQ